MYVGGLHYVPFKFVFLITWGFMRSSWFLEEFSRDVFTFGGCLKIQSNRKNDDIIFGR